MTSRPWGLLLRLILYPVLGVAAVVLPVVLWNQDWAILAYTSSKTYQLFELLGLCAGAALLVVAAVELWPRRRLPWPRLVPGLLALLVGLHYLVLITEYSNRPWDYQCYEYAARAIVAGGDPYDQSVYSYKYTPLPAQAMAWLYRGLEPAAAALQEHMGSEGPAGWYLLYYLFQYAQLLLLLGAYGMGARLAARLGLAPLPAAVLSAVLLLGNGQVLRTLRYGNTNLWLLDLALAAILLVDQAAPLSGLAAALGGFIKLYPLVLLGPWLLTRRWQALLGAAVGLGGAVLLSTAGGRDWALWQQYLGFFSDSFYKGYVFRDNSLYSIVYNLLRLTGLRPAEALGPGLLRGDPWLNGTVLAASLAVLAWFAWRFWQRERGWRAARAAAPQDGRRGAFLRQTGHAVDALALALIVSPMVLEYHYLLAVPLVIWAAARRGRERPWLVGLGAVLALALPTFDFFPLSLHRLAGLVLLLILTRPSPGGADDAPDPAVGLAPSAGPGPGMGRA